MRNISSNLSTLFLKKHFHLLSAYQGTKSAPQETLAEHVSFLLIKAFGSHYCRMLSRTPAATAEPITPATFGPIACIKRKLPGFSS